MSEKRIKQLVPAAGDWFKINIEHLDGDKKHIVMSRVCAWAIMTCEPPSPDTIIDSIEGIDSDGYGHVEEDQDYVYVHGDDLAPNGKSWRNVFNETPSFNWGLKDISELADMIDSRAKLAAPLANTSAG